MEKQKGALARVGWIGIGAMGLPICANLVRGGYQVVGIDKQPSRSQLLPGIGASAAPSIAALADASDVVFSMVFDDDALRSVVTGPGGVAASMQAGKLFVDLSTVSPQASAEVATALNKAGIRYLRAPVSGSVGIAEAGKLTIFASGSRADFDEIQPLLALVSSTQHYLGDGEASRVVKLAINLMVAESTAQIGEAIEFGVRNGVARSLMVDALNASIVGSRHFEFRAASLKTRDYNGSGPMHLVAKDMDLVLRIAEDQGLRLPLLSLVRQYAEILITEGKRDVEVTALAEFPRPVAAGPATASEAWQRAVLAADDARYRAMAAGDEGALRLLLAESLVYTHSSADVESKAAYLASVRAGHVKYLSVDRRTANFVALDDGTVLMHGHVVIEAEIRGVHKKLNNLYQSVWTASGPDGKWQMATWASTAIPPGKDVAA